MVCTLLKDVLPKSMKSYDMTIMKWLVMETSISCVNYLVQSLKWKIGSENPMN